MGALQESTKAYLIGLIEDTNPHAIHAKEKDSQDLSYRISVSPIQLLLGLLSF